MKRQIQVSLKVASVIGAVLALVPGDLTHAQASQQFSGEQLVSIAAYIDARTPLYSDVPPALSTLSLDGRPWRGRAVPSGTLVFNISDTDSLASRKAAHRLEGARALATGQFAVAVEQYRALVQTDPSDIASYGGLGQALLAAGQYEEAAAALEIALPLALREKSAIPEWLAYAYLVLGDETNAVRVLRLIVAPRDVPSRLDGLRAAARRR